jgi:endonuclease YncB( thermonuclease family)
MRRWSALLLVCLLALPVQAAELAGRVVGVTDGDTLRVLVEQREVIVRLDQIDAPEKAQPFGQRSRQSLAELSFGKAARVVTHGQDRYGRTIGTVFVGELDVNAEQVRRGMAWAFLRYLREPALLDIEREARTARRGLWADAEPVAPWEWRAGQREPHAP